VQQQTNIQDKVKQFYRDLDILDDGIAQLRREYDLFFAGQTRNPPVDLRKRVESIIKRYRGAQIQKTDLQFRYSALVARYNAYSDYWEKVLKRRESDPKAMSAWSPSAEALAALGDGNGGNGRDAALAGNGAFTGRESPAEKAAWKLFAEFVEAKRYVGDSLTDLTFENFKNFVNRQKEQIIKVKQCKDVEFAVNVKDGRVSLKAKAVRGSGECPAAARGPTRSD
jgi:hypothetical protein